MLSPALVGVPTVMDGKQAFCYRYVITNTQLSNDGMYQCKAKYKDIGSAAISGHTTSDNAALVVLGA